MQLVVKPTGQVRCVYTERVNLSALGILHIRRASLVEPTSLGRWTADLSPVGGPVLGPFFLRSEALAAEARWLDSNVIG